MTVPDKKLSVIIAVLLFSFIACISAVHAEKANTSAAPTLMLWTPGEPLDISAGSMRFESESSRIVFETDVKLTQRGLDLHCSRLTLDSDAQGSLKGFIAEGALKIRRAGLEISAMRAEYDHAARRLVLSGSPEVKRAADLVRGERITIDFASGSVTIEKAQARVNVGAAADKDGGNE